MKIILVKKHLLFILLFAATVAKAQKIDSIYINLYTDSLKKGTYNYINVDGLLRNGRYLPLDSTHLIFTASAGNFYGNSLLIDRNFTGEKILIKIVLRQNPAVTKEFYMWVKKKENDEQLKTAEEILNGMQSPPKTKSKRKKA
jgi:hypothetical protein